MYYRELAKATFAYPAIDNHAHPLLTKKHRNALAFEGLVSEASGDALADSIHTLASYRSTAQLAKLFGLKSDDAKWDEVKKKRANLDYEELCRMCMKPSGIQCILIDDGLAGVADLAESYEWHDQFTSSPTKRIVRIETVAEVRASLVSLLLTVLQSLYRTCYSTCSLLTVLIPTHQQSALLWLPLRSNLCKAYLKVRANQKSSGSSPLFVTGTYDFYAIHVLSCHSIEQDRT